MTEPFARARPLTAESVGMETSRQQQQWVLRAQVHDREALELLLRSIQSSLRRFLSGLVGGTDADDVLQDVLIQISRKLGWLRSPELFRPWAFRIAGRAGVRYLKKHKRWMEPPVDDYAVESLSVPVDDSIANLMDLVLKGSVLSSGSRAVLVLHFLEEMTPAEVAAILEIPIGTVKSRLAAGLAALRKHIANQRSL
jgi:RNA polymerase sigma-70 factor (ECF subfamily)